MPRHETIPWEGEFNCWTRHFDLPDVIFSICRAEESGLLRFVSAEAEKTLFFRKGEIVFATSSSQDDRLGEYLLKTGRIRLKVLMELGKEVRPGKRLGAVLVEKKILTEADLKRAVTEQVESIVTSLVRWTDAWYGFNSQELPGREDIMLQKRTVKLILEAVRHIDSWRRILKGVGDLDSVYQLAANQEETIRRLDLDTQSLSLLATLRRPQRVEMICASSELHDFEVCRLLWVFKSLGLIAPPAANDLAFPVAGLHGDAEAAAGPTEPPEAVEKPGEPPVPPEHVPQAAAVAFSSPADFVSVPLSESTLPPPPSEATDPFSPASEEPVEVEAPGLDALPLPPDSDYSYLAPKPKPTMMVTDLPFQPLQVGPDGSPTVDLHVASDVEIVEDMSEIIIDAESSDIPLTDSEPSFEVEFTPQPAELSVPEADGTEREKDLAFALGKEDYSVPPQSTPPTPAQEPSAHLPLGTSLSPDGRGGGVPATSKEMPPQRPIQEEAPLEPDLDLDGLGMVLGSDKRP